MLKQFSQPIVLSAILKRNYALIQAAYNTQATNFEQEWVKAKPYESIPGRNKLQFIASFLPGGKYYKASMTEMHSKMLNEFGKICRFPGLFGRDEIVMIYDPNDMEQVLRNEGHWPYRRGLETLQYYRKKLRPEVYSEVGGLFTEQGEEWQKMRTISNPVLMQPKVAKLYISTIDQIAKEFVELSGSKRDALNEMPSNFSEYLNRWSLESISYVALDRRLGLLDENSTDIKAVELFKHIRDFFELGFQFEVMPSIWKYYKTKSFKNLLKVYDGITNINLNFVNETIASLKDKKRDDDHEPSVLEKLLKVNKNVAVVMCADMMLAGVDTTSSGAVGVLYCLAKNPDKQEKLREEVMKFLPDKSTPLTAEMLSNMPYLKAVIKEGIRLFPPTSGTMRKTTRDLVLQGYRVPKGTDVVTATILLHKDNAQFPDNLKFLPERWLKDPIARGQCPSAKDAHPFAYLPFGFGKRMCIGKRFADLEIEVLTVNMIRHFKLEWHHPEMEIKSVLVNYPKSPLKFRLIDV